ncbi:MAG: cob(I)yrinic acid a,c-diamide adenosyltransferase [Desulfobacter sp.]|nr:cob(I)yrinic acid a,c-diamide adenosyltransferase [Desulfobacter sp.]WDP86837.1 MAG: cob(I)yrinic acid a,c-diamide adenosyltransferase [Desulfobacter sp.]
MKLYTGTGDRGKTSLFSGERVMKSSLQVEAYGEIDELNSFIGIVKAAWEIEDPELDRQIDCIQAQLLEAGAWMATRPGASSALFLPPFTHEPAQALESVIDQLSEHLPELKHFILPQGHLSATMAQAARAVCRRAERRMIAFATGASHGESKTDTLKNILVFLNRLSDYLFILARYLNKRHGMEDTLWKP